MIELSLHDNLIYWFNRRLKHCLLLRVRIFKDWADLLWGSCWFRPPRHTICATFLFLKQILQLQYLRYVCLIGWHLYSAFIKSAVKFMLLIHPSTAIGCHARHQSARQEQLGIKFLAQEYFNTPRVDWTGNLPTARWQLFLLSQCRPYRSQQLGRRTTEQRPTLFIFITFLCGAGAYRGETGEQPNTFRLSPN